MPAEHRDPRTQPINSQFPISGQPALRRKRFEAHRIAVVLADSGSIRKARPVLRVGLVDESVLERRLVSFYLIMIVLRKVCFGWLAHLKDGFVGCRMHTSQY